MKKKILTICLVVALAATAVIGGTLAYFTDTDTQTNTFTSGNVQIEQHEKDRDGNDFVQGQKLMPIVDDVKDANGYHTGANYIDKIVTVENTGTEAAYVRTFLAIPAALDDGPTTFDAGENILHWNGASANDTFGAANWGGTIENDWYWCTDTNNDYPSTATADLPNKGWNFYQSEIDGVLYNVYVATHASAVEAGATTAPNLFGLYLDKDVDYADGNYIDKYDEIINYDLTQAKVLLISEAVQAEGFDTTDPNVAFYALDKAFGAIGTYCPFGGTVQ